MKMVKDVTERTKLTRVVIPNYSCESRWWENREKEISDESWGTAPEDMVPITCILITPV